jgi:uncharacterized OB-fold protein
VVDGDKMKIPCQEGLWSIPSSLDETPQLMGNKCLNCGEIFFPANPICLNCQNKNMKKIKLSNKGKIWSYTTIMLAPPKWYKGPVPFDLGYIELPEKILIWSRLLGAEPGTFKIGQEVELKIDIIQKNNEGNDILGYCFIPIKHNKLEKK